MDAAIHTLVFEISQTPQALIARIGGDLGIVESAELERQLTNVFLHRPSRVIIDLAGVTMASSLAMGKFIWFHRSMCRTAVVKFAAIQPKVLLAFERARLNDVLAICATVEEALVA